jgi:RES domain-containing protein
VRLRVQPNPEYDNLLRRIEQLRHLAVPGRMTAFRSVRPRYWSSGEYLTGEGSRIHGGRWNAPHSFATVYLSHSLKGAWEEFNGQRRKYGFAPESMLPRVFSAVNVELSQLLELTDGAVRQRLRVSLNRMITEDWETENRGGRESLTQAIGRAACEVKLEGLLVPSAQRAGGSNIVVFRHNMLPHSKLQEIASG